MWFGLVVCFGKPDHGVLGGFFRIFNRVEPTGWFGILNQFSLLLLASTVEY